MVARPLGLSYLGRSPTEIETSMTHVFGDLTIVDATAGSSSYGHTFGGPVDRSDALPDKTNGIRLHMLHRFDMNDPLMPIQLPGLRWLPLYYVFDFRANEVGYQLTSDSKMITFFSDNEPNISDAESWPADDFPLEFSSHPIRLALHDFDPTDLDDVARWAGISNAGLTPIVMKSATIALKVTTTLITYPRHFGKGHLIIRASTPSAPTIKSPGR